MVSMEEMASKGSGKLSRKAGSMATSYNAAKARMIQHYAAVGFGPTRQANYSAGVNAATWHAPDPAKWSANWLAKMRE